MALGLVKEVVSLERQSFYTHEKKGGTKTDNSHVISSTSYYALF